MPVAIPQSLHSLLDFETLEAFLHGPWETAPVLAREKIRDRAEDLLTLDQLEALIAGALAGSQAGVSVVQDLRARPIAQSAAPAELLDVALDAYRGGSTLLFSGLQRVWSPVARLCREIENGLIAEGLAFTESVAANAYLSPRRSQGFGIHYDNHCVVVLQLHGKKTWEVFAPQDAFPVARCEQHIPRARLGSPLLATTLEAGDVLYLPRGFPHVAICEADSSMHLSLSLRTRTWSDLIASMSAKLPALRRSVPPSRANEDVIRHSFNQEILAGLASQDPVDDSKRRVAEALSNLSSLPGGRVRAIDEAEDVRGETWLVRAPFVTCQAHVEEGQSVLRFPGRAARLPEVMKPVFDFLATQTAFRASDLPTINANYDAQALVRLLIAQGLLRADHEACQDTSRGEVEETGSTIPTIESIASRSPLEPRALSFRRGDGPSEGTHLGWSYSAERLSAELCKELVDACHQFPVIPASTVGQDRYPDHRQADARKIGVTPRTQWIFDFLARIAAEVSATVSVLELTEIARAPQYVEYRPDWGRFDWHNDYSHEQPFAPRKLTIILQLSPPNEYEGGSLEAFGTVVTELPREQGSVLVFPSILPHRVTPVTAGVRRALVAWIAGPRMR